MPIARGSGIHQRCGGTGFHRIAFNFNEAMKPLLASKSLPAWQIERAEKLQRACQTIKAAIQRGEKISKTIQRVSRRLHGRSYKSDPARRIALAPGTLRCMWDKWKLGGEIPTAFILKYYTQKQYIIRPLLLLFLEFCLANRSASVRQAWQKFSKNKRYSRQVSGISYAQVLSRFPVADFYLAQAQLQAIEAANGELDKIRFHAIAHISGLSLPLPKTETNIKS
jgi:hypothetical protein